MDLTLLKLFEEVQLGALKLKNRFIVAPLTRQKTNPDDGIPNDLLVEYYTQRASFGMIITESCQVSPHSSFYPGSPGIHSEEQVEGWKRVTDSVHRQGGLIILQLWHCGRILKQSQSKGVPPISSTDRQAPQSIIQNIEEFAKPEKLTKEGIKKVVEEFRQGAINAKKAGFDGIQLMAANGYLVDQFLRDSVNDRTDEYGGSVENRSRFCLEVMDAMISVFGADRVAIRLSPTGRVNEMYDSDPLSLLKYLIPELEKRDIAFIEVKRHAMLQMDSPLFGGNQIPTKEYFSIIKQMCKGKFVGNDGITIEDMKEYVNNNVCDAVSFGKFSMANPDLPERIKNGWELNKPIDRSLWSTKGARGYTDYPFYNQISETLKTE